MAVLLSRAIGGVFVDVVVSEQVTASMEVPTHPVEKGAKISDHTWRSPTMLRMSCAAADPIGTYQALFRVMATAEPFSIVTGFGVFRNMLLTRIDPKREIETGNILDFGADGGDHRLHVGFGRRERRGRRRARRGPNEPGRSSGARRAVARSEAHDRPRGDVMATVTEIPVIDAPFQTLTTSLNGRAVGMAFAWNETSGRWSFDLSIGGEPAIVGRRIVIGADLLKPFGLGLGKLVAVDWDGDGADPGRAELPAGKVRLLSYVG